MHNPEPTNPITDLRAVAAQIEARRLDLGLSKNELCRKFGQLGSTKTYGRILNENDPLEGVIVPRQLGNYQVAWELLQTYTEDPEANRLYHDFEFVRGAVAAVHEALDQPDITRLVLVTGGPGAGKTAFLDILEETRQTANIFYRVEATEAWRESTNELLGALLMEVGMFDRAPAGGDTESRQRLEPEKALPIGPAARLRKLEDRLDSRKVILGIDEAHHIGPAGYNIIKTLINRTRAAVVMTAIPELITRINKAAHAEAKQLFFNRLYEHVRLGAPQAGDVLEFLRRRGVKFTSPKDASAIAAKIADDAQSHGLWKYVVRCARRARRQEGPLDAAAFAKIILAVKGAISLGG